VDIDAPTEAYYYCVLWKGLLITLEVEHAHATFEVFSVIALFSYLPLWRVSAWPYSEVRIRDGSYINFIDIAHEHE
jgi:hypothetical protein